MKGYAVSCHYWHWKIIAILYSLVVAHKIIMSFYTSNPNNIPVALRRFLTGSLSSSGTPLPTSIMVSTDIPVNSSP
jgi:hypothetical protein